MSNSHSYAEKDVTNVFHQAGVVGGDISRARFIKSGMNPRGDAIWSPEEIDFLGSLLLQADYSIQDGPLRGRRDIAALQRVMEEKLPNFQRSREAIRAQIRRLNIESIGGSGGA